MSCRSRVCTALISLLPFAGARATDVLQFGYDGSHSGNNTAETIIGADNVGSLQLGYSANFSGTDGQAVFLQKVATSAGTRDVLFATTTNGVQAIDAATGSPIWTQSTSSYEYSNSASPVIDPNRQFVYGPGSDGRVHKLSVANGAEVQDGTWPVQSSYKPAIEKASAPLSLAVTPQGAFIYSTTSSYNDEDDYQGHLTAIDLGSGSSKVYNAACSDLHIHFVEDGTAGVDDCANQGSGMWGRGAVWSPYSNRVFVTTGNGPFDGRHNWGDSVLALGPDGSGGSDGAPLDSYTPAEYDKLWMYDLDLGGTSLTLLPPAGGRHLGVQIGKDGTVRLLDLDNLSGQGAPGRVGGELQNISLIPGNFAGSALPQPAVWTDVHGDSSIWVFISATATLSGFQLTLGTPQLQQRWIKTETSESSSPTIANDVIYTLTEGRYGANLIALDPRTGNTLWTSDTIAGCCHTQNPIVVNGHVYLATSSVVTMFTTNSVSPPPPPPVDISQKALPMPRPTRTTVRPISSAQQREH
jgi:outer membrane protein assembly factor BamB